MAMINLLTDDVFTLRASSGDLRQVPLPALYAALMADAVEDLPVLRPHQRQPIHAFLVQAGALALDAAGRDEPPDAAGDWAALLRGLTPGFPGDEPWTLVVPDVSKPAFMQPPIPEGTIEALKEIEPTPDALDMLVTAKNHDVKAARLARATPEHWLAALVTLQTQEGFLGAGNYGISRMNGGFASRPMVGLAPKGGIGAHVRRDIRRLLALRGEPALAAYARAGGLGLVWLEPWDGATGLTQDRLHPWYIEICRRVRLAEAGGRILARRGGSKAARIAAPKEMNGVTGDPWTPVASGEAGRARKALNIGAGGFDYKLVTELLASDAFEPAPLQMWCQDDGAQAVSLVMTCLARGQGETQGFHERRLPIPPGRATNFGQPRDPYAGIAKQRVADAGTARRAVLRTALFVLFQNAPDELDLRHQPSETRAAPFLAAFDRRVDAIFFSMIPAELEAEAENRPSARAAWLNALFRLVQDTLDEAAASVPLSGLRRYTTIEAARARLDAAFHKHFLAQASEAP